MMKLISTQQSSLELVPTEGKTVDVKCRHQKTVEQGLFYLCKNGSGMRVRELEKGEDDTIFTIKDVKGEDSAI